MNPFKQDIKSKPWFSDVQFDTEYVNLVKKTKVIKTGEGDYDYVLEDVYIEERTPIKEVVARDSGQFSVKSILERVALTGDESLIPAGQTYDGKVNDFTNMPDNLMDLNAKMQSAEALYAGMPTSLTQGRSFEEFCSTLSKEELDTFINATVSTLSGNVNNTQSGNEGGNE